METLGERLVVARKAARLSQRDLAKRAGVSATAVSKYERDLDVPGSRVLLGMAHALDRRVDFFLRSREVTISCAEFRKKASLGEKGKAAVLATVQEQSERYLETLELYSPEDSPVPSLLLTAREVRSLVEVEAVAENVRAVWQLGMDPIESLIGVLEDNGIHVMLIPGADAFDAFTCWINGEFPVIAVRDGVPGDRQRLSLAHELGHLLVRTAPGVDAEKAAYRFGAALLVPREAALRELGSVRSALEIPDELILLKNKYGISMAAWIIRARDLGIIRHETAERYFRLFSKKRWWQREPGDPYPAEEPQKLKQMVLRALAEGVLTESRAAELLREPVRSWFVQDQNAPAA